VQLIDARGGVPVRVVDTRISIVILVLVSERTPPVFYDLDQVREPFCERDAHGAVSRTVEYPERPGSTPEGQSVRVTIDDLSLVTVPMALPIRQKIPERFDIGRTHHPEVHIDE
jgi:hypothetical protein